MHYLTKITFLRHILLAIFLSTFLFGMVHAEPSPPISEKPQLKRVVILLRHGVRVPFLPGNVNMNNYSALPWPIWPTKLGLLTPHGFKLAQGLGNYFRSVYKEPLHLSQQECKVIDLNRSRTDNIQRTKKTGQAFLNGFLPKCSINIPHTPSHQHDPYFFPLRANICTPNKAFAYNEAVKYIGSYEKLLQDYAAPLALVQTITGCCNPVLCKDKQPNSCTLLELPGTIQSNGEVGGPFYLASCLIETIYLQKAEGFPSKEVAWGKTNDAVIAQLDSLHVESHKLRGRLPYLAQTQGSSLAALIFASIQEAVQNESVPPFVLLVGHDNNIDNIGALFGLDWHPKTYAKNQVPPASSLIFELYYYPESKQYRVKSYFVTQTLDEMAKLQLASQETPPEWVPVQNDQCTSTGPSEGCPYEQWSKLIQENLNKDCVAKDLLPVLE